MKSAFSSIARGSILRPTRSLPFAVPFFCAFSFSWPHWEGPSAQSCAHEEWPRPPSFVFFAFFSCSARWGCLYLSFLHSMCIWHLEVEAFAGTHWLPSTSRPQEKKEERRPNETGTPPQLQITLLLCFPHFSLFVLLLPASSSFNSFPILVGSTSTTDSVNWNPRL